MLGLFCDQRHWVNEHHGLRACCPYSGGESRYVLHVEEALAPCCQRKQLFTQHFYWPEYIRCWSYFIGYSPRMIATNMTVGEKPIWRLMWEWHPQFIFTSGQLLTRPRVAVHLHLLARRWTRSGIDESSGTRGGSRSCPAGCTQRRCRSPATVTVNKHTPRGLIREWKHAALRTNSLCCR
jgi:hypothetical protein